MDKWVEVGVGVITATIGLAALALILSSQSKTSSVIDSASKGLSSLITAAVSPVTGTGGMGNWSNGFTQNGSIL